MLYSLINQTPPQGAVHASPERARLADGFARQISYLRLSVTDRCDLRCTYCMPERMTFLPKKEVLSFEELTRIVDAFISRGVTKLRVTGGEPLVRKDVIALLERFAQRLDGGGLEELTLTTNGTHLAEHANRLAEIGVRRVNVSLDTLNKDLFAQLTRRDVFDQVMAGLDAAARAGLKVKINTVALADANRHEIPAIIDWAHGRGFDVSLIEVMPVGEEVGGRVGAYLSLEDVRADLGARWTLTPEDFSTGGPSRYVRVAETGGRLGFISPLSHNFCSDCNRVRLTCTGRLYTCLGHEDGADLRAALRADPTLGALHEAVEKAVRYKPERHDFDAARLDSATGGARTMSTTGG